MATKTYIPQLVLLARILCRYMQRWERQIRENLDATAEPLFDALLVACEAFELVVTLPPEGD